MPLQNGLDHIGMATLDETVKQLDKEKSGTSWRQNEEHVIPKNRLGIVFFAILCVTSTVVLDHAMVSIALPTIASHLGSAKQYNWLGSANLLGASALGPLYGKWSDMFGRKTVFFASIVTFLISSALCGAAQSVTWLIVGRAFQGLGGLGVNQLAIVIISDIVPLKERGPYSGCLGAITGVAHVIGPIIGGVLTQHVSWRWCFFMILPISSVAAIVLLIFLNLNPHQNRPFRVHLAELDFIGIIFIALGIVCLIIGIIFGQESWSDTKAIIPVVAGCVMLITAGINEVYTQRSQVIPPRLFKTRTTGIILINSFILAFVDAGGSYYLPLYYQILGASPTEAGIRMLPYYLGYAFSSIMSGIIVSRTGSYRPIYWAAWTFTTVGWGLMIMLSNGSSVIEQAGIPLIAALGVGCLHQVPIIAIQASMPLKDVATSTSAFVFSQLLGASVSISLGGAIISNVLPAQLAAIPNVGSFNFGSSIGSVVQAIHQIPLIPNLTLRKAIMDAFSRSISTIWAVYAALSGLGLVLGLFIRGYSLERKIVHGDDGKVTCVEKAVGTSTPEKEDNIKVYSASVEATSGDSTVAAALEKEMD